MCVLVVSKNNAVIGGNEEENHAMNEVILYALAIIPGVLLLCVQDVPKICGVASVGAAVFVPMPFVVVGGFCVIPLVFLVGMVAVLALQSVCD